MENSDFDSLIVQNIPFAPSINPFLKESDLKDQSSEQSLFTNKEQMEDSFSLQENQDKIILHQLEIEKETYRIESLKNSLKLKENEKTIEDLKKKIARLSLEKSPGPNNDQSCISIPKSELAEINYHRMMLEKEVNKLKKIITEKEIEIKDLQIEVQNSERNMPVLVTPGHSRKSSALASLDGNALNLRKNGGEDKDIKNRLHESLKINDELTNKIKELKDRVKELESDKGKSPETCFSNNSVRRNSRTSSISSFNQLKKYEAEQDLELYVKKYKEAIKEIEKYEDIHKANQQTIETLNQKLESKKEKLKNSNETIKNLQISGKSLESQFVSYRSQKEVELDRCQTEITNLKRALDSLHNDKEELERKYRCSDDLKSKLSAVVQSWEASKSNEAKLFEDLSKLKSIHNLQESQYSNAASRLSQLEHLYQNLESTHSSTLKSLADKESALQVQLEKNSKLSGKLQKARQKIVNFKAGSQNTFNDFKELTRNFMSEKQYSDKLADQNTELKYVVKSLEESREKLRLKNEELSNSRSELISRLNTFEHSAFEKLSSMNALKEDQEKCLNENASLKFEIKKKSEELVLAKAETRKVLGDLSECNMKIKKSQEQEDFLQKLLKNSDSEVKRLNDKIMFISAQSDEKEQKLAVLNSEISSLKNQVNVLSADLKKTENSYRLLNIENYSLQSRIEELDKIRIEPACEGSFKDEYFKLVRAYQHVNEELAATRANLAQTKTELPEQKTQKDPAIVEAHIERLQIRLEGALDEKVSMERKIEFLSLEKAELEKTVQKLKEELELKEKKTGSGEKYLKEIQRCKSEIRRLENEQEKLKHELSVALSRANSVQKYVKSMEEAANIR